MIINAKDGNLINSNMVNVHDFIFEKFIFDRKSNELVITLFNEASNLQHVVKFTGVIGFEMSACDFWGKSPYILDFEYIEPHNQNLADKLFARKEASHHPFCELKDKNEYFETMLTFTSGDQLCLVCESVQIN